MALFDDGQVGSVGTLLGAALETCGHYLQSQLLDVMQSGLGTSLGMLLFLMAGIAAIFIIAVGGNYKYGLYFLLAPALFWQTTLIRVPSYGAQWIFADEERPISEVHNAAGEVASELADPSDTDYSIKDMNVSWFFALWNDFSSNVIRTFVQLLQVQTLRSEITFANKVERYLDFYRLEVTDPAVKKFMVLATQNRCPEYFRAMQMYFNPAIDGAQKAAKIKPLIDKHGKKIAFGEGDKADMMKFINDIGMANQMCKAWHDGAVAIFPMNESPFQDCPAAPTNGDPVTPPQLQERAFTCHDVWRMSIAMLRVHGQSLIENLVSNKVANDWDPSGNPLDRDDLIVETRLQLAKKFAQINYGADFGGSRRENVTPDEAMVYMLNELSAQLLVKQLKGLESDISQQNRNHRRLTQILPGRTMKEDLSADIRLINERMEWRGKGDLYTAALALPYIQGLLLYWLAAAYPFFACALLIPGRHVGFTLWMGLWFWVKSWDFGYALVMVIDEMLYLMFPHGDPVHSNELDQPHELIQTLLEVDPIHSESMYYNLIAACMLSIPMITGIMVKKGGGQILDQIQSGYANFAGRSGHSLSAFYGSLRAQEARGEAQMRMIKAGEDAFYRSVQNNSNVKYHAAMAQELNRRADAVAKGSLKLSSGDLSAINKTLSSAGLQTVDKLTGNTQSVVAGVLRAKADQHYRVAQGHIKRDVAYARWHESMSEENRRLAGDAILLRYYSHDFTDEPPVESEINLMQQKNFVMLANVADQGLAGWYHQGPELFKRLGQLAKDAVGSDVDKLRNSNMDPTTQAEIQGRGYISGSGTSSVSGQGIPTTLEPKNK